MDAQSNPDGETLFVKPERPKKTSYSVPEVAIRVEAIAPVYRRGLAELKPDRQNRLRIRPRIVKQIVRSRGAEGAPPTYLSRSQAGFVLSDEEMSLDTDPEQVRTDAAPWIEFFANYNNGFLATYHVSRATVSRSCAISSAKWRCVPS